MPTILIMVRIRVRIQIFRIKSLNVKFFRGGSRLQIWPRQGSVIKAPISFLNIHQLLWKNKILVHGHVRTFLNFVTFPLIVLIKIEEVTKNIFVKTEFVINNKPPFKKSEQLHMIRLCCS